MTPLQVLKALEAVAIAARQSEQAANELEHLFRSKRKNEERITRQEIMDVAEMRHDAVSEWNEGGTDS